MDFSELFLDNWRQLTGIDDVVAKQHPVTQMLWMWLTANWMILVDFAPKNSSPVGQRG